MHYLAVQGDKARPSAKVNRPWTYGFTPADALHSAGRTVPATSILNAQTGTSGQNAAFEPRTSRIPAGYRDHPPETRGRGSDFNRFAHVDREIGDMRQFDHTAAGALSARHRPVPGAHLLRRRLAVEPCCGDILALRVEGETVTSHAVQVAKERLLVPGEAENAKRHRDMTYFTLCLSQQPPHQDVVVAYRGEGPARVPVRALMLAQRVAVPLVFHQHLDNAGMRDRVSSQLSFIYMNFAW